MYSNLTSLEAIHLAPAMTALKRLHLPAFYEERAAALLVALVQADDPYRIAHMEGQGQGFAEALSACQVVDHYECSDLCQVFKDTAHTMRSVS